MQFVLNTQFTAGALTSAITSGAAPTAVEVAVMSPAAKPHRIFFASFILPLPKLDRPQPTPKIALSQLSPQGCQEAGLMRLLVGGGGWAVAPIGFARYEKAAEGVPMLTTAELVWLLAAVAKGDQAAFEQLYAATRAKLFGVVLRILRRHDLADEVLQETYLKVWRNAGQFDPRLSTPITWMVAIARNRAIDLVRRRTETSIEEEPEAMDVAAESPNPLARRELTEELTRLLACIGRLDAERQRLVLLAYYDGWSREQLAVKLDKPVNTIKTWLRRSLMEIRECLGS
jgi:RNA polymerase sigma-70 factor (ECF subfamily)